MLYICQGVFQGYADKIGVPAIICRNKRRFFAGINLIQRFIKDMLVKSGFQRFLSLRREIRQTFLFRYSSGDMPFAERKTREKYEAS